MYFAYEWPSHRACMNCPRGRREWRKRGEEISWRAIPCLWLHACGEQPDVRNEGKRTSSTGIWKWVVGNGIWYTDYITLQLRVGVSVSLFARFLDGRTVDIRKAPALALHRIYITFSPPSSNSPPPPPS